MHQTASTISASPRSNTNDSNNNWQCHRTYSHLGFRSSTAQCMGMHHFHVPPQRSHGIPFVSFRSPSKYCRQFQNQNPFIDQPIPEIKCSLCNKYRICKRKLEMNPHSSTETFSRFHSSNELEFSSIHISDTDETIRSSKKECLNNAKKIIVTIWTNDVCSVEVETFSRNWYTWMLSFSSYFTVDVLFILTIEFFIILFWESSRVYIVTIIKTLF